MNTMELSRWLREEHGLVDDLIESVAERVAIVPRRFGDRWIIELRDRFASLRAHLQRHIALEEQDGYMLAILDRRPDLADEVDRLKQEHRDLFDMMNEIHSVLIDVTPDRVMRARHLMAWLGGLDTRL